MLLDSSVACLFVALMGGVIVVRRRQHRRRLVRGERLLKQALDLADTDDEVSCQSYLSGTRLEMELLLMDLHLTGTSLTEALATEADLASGINEDSPDEGVAEWIEARRAVEHAQQNYEVAAEAYQEFLETLPPPLREKAAERGGLGRLQTSVA